MKYFEVIEPYYALIKAENEEKAIEVYVETVAYDEPDMPIKDEIKEVKMMYAYSKYEDAPGEDGKILFGDMIKEFTRERNEVLLIDGSLI